jgi:hypothetical protein
MTLDPFTDRLARVRRRFVSTLEGKIEGACAAIPQLSDGVPAAAPAVAEAYRCMHGIVGIGPTVGFPASGRAARDVEDLLRVPQRDKRGLTDDEIVTLKNRLQALREAATRELQVIPSEVIHSV